MAIFILVIAAIMVLAAIGFFIASYFVWAEWLIALLANIVMVCAIMSVLGGIIWGIVCLFLLL